MSRRRVVPPVAMVDTTLVAAAAIALVALIALVLFVAVAKAWKRTGNSRLSFVGLAFFVFFVKGALVAAVLLQGWLAHEHLEMVEAGFDLTALGLLAVPLVVRR